MGAKTGPWLIPLGTLRKIGQGITLKDKHNEVQERYRNPKPLIEICVKAMEVEVLGAYHVGVTRKFAEIGDKA